MSIVAGVDFGTLSVRVSIVDSRQGCLGSAGAEYPLERKQDDPDYATQKYQDHMDALVSAMRSALQDSGVEGDQVLALALDTTGSSIIPVDKKLDPLDDYYLWCDHRASQEAEQITEAARSLELEAIRWCGGVYSSEWGFAKLLHWLRHNPAMRPRMATALEHCDMVAATLCEIDVPAALPRSVCAMGHKWMWSDSLGGLPPEEFLVQVDPLLAGVREKLGGCYGSSDRLAGCLASNWAEKLGLKADIPIPVGALDAHWDAIGAGIREGDVVNVVGTSTCIMAIAPEVGLIPGVCGVVKGSIHPDYYGIEAGLSATGAIFEAIARRASTSVAELCGGLEDYLPGQTGLLRMTWDNGDRTVLVNANLGGMTLGWNLTSTARDELYSAIEGTALHTRIILDRLSEHGVSIQRIINGGGIPQKNQVLNQVYADVLQKPVLVPEQEVTSLGSAIFAFLAAGVFETIEEAQDALCPSYRVVEPRPEARLTYEELHGLYRKLYFSYGVPDSEPVGAGEVLARLRSLAAEARQ